MGYQASRGGTTIVQGSIGNRKYEVLPGCMWYRLSSRKASLSCAGRVHRSI
jgi:hypothetical protein